MLRLLMPRTDLSYGVPHVSGALSTTSRAAKTAAAAAILHPMQ